VGKEATQKAHAAPGGGDLTRAQVSFTLPLPPSLNSQYVKFRKKGGKRGFALSDEAKAFEKAVKSVVGSDVFALQSFPVGDRELVYEMEVVLYIDGLQNPGWFERYLKGKYKGERKAVGRYKRVDTDNRLKFLQDKLCDSLGIPGDEQIFSVKAVKMQSSEERTEVTIRVVDRGQFFPDGGEEPHEE